MQCAFLLWPKNPARKRTLTPALYRARRERGAAAAAQKIREREREEEEEEEEGGFFGVCPVPSVRAPPKIPKYPRLGVLH